MSRFPFGSLMRRESEQPESNDIRNLRRLPWYCTDLPPQLSDGRGMIADDERRLLYVLAHDYFRDEGAIIDGGTFLGDSSMALGYGLKNRGFAPKKAIHAFDLFIIDEPSAQHHLPPSDAPGHTIKGGDNIRFIYENRTREVSQYIEIHEGDVTKETWTGGPVEILFSDISKSWEINDYILQNWIPSLIPERGILIQQDQVQQYHVWVGITMEMLSDHFECLDYVRNSSMVYRLKRPIPKADITRCLSANVSTDDMERAYLGYLEKFRSVGMGRYSGWMLGMVEVGLIAVYGWHIGDMDKARHAWNAVDRKFGHIHDTRHRLDEIKRNMDEGTPCAGAKLGW